MRNSKYKYPSRDSIQNNSSGITILEQFSLQTNPQWFVCVFSWNLLAVSKGVSTEDQKVKGFNPAGI